MTRNVNLVSYLPSFLAEFKENIALLHAENSEFEFLWKSFDRILKNEYISTADESGLSRFEDIVGIKPLSDDTLESRRSRVFSRWFNHIPLTLKGLKKRLALICGEQGYSVTIKDYAITISVYTRFDSQKEELKQLINDVIPENMLPLLIYEKALKFEIYNAGIISEANIFNIRQVS